MMILKERFHFERHGTFPTWKQNPKRRDSPAFWILFPVYESSTDLMGPLDCHLMVLDQNKIMKRPRRYYFGTYR